MGDLRCGILLEVVRRQHILVCCHKRFEKSPGSARDLPQSQRLGRRNLRDGLNARRKADIARDSGRDQPQRDERRRNRPTSAPEHDRQKQRRRGEGKRPRHSDGEPLEIETLCRRGLRRGSPLEQVSVTDQEPPQRPRDGVAHRPGLIRQKRNIQRRQCRRETEIPPERSQVPGYRNTRTTSRNCRDHGYERSQNNGREHERRPDKRRFKRQRPADRQRQKASGRAQRSTQVVDHLPATDPRQFVPGGRRPAAFACETENPRQELPVSASPAVVTQGAHIVSRRKIVHDFDVRREARARERPLEQVMAQQGRIRSPARKDAFERIEIVDAFSCVRAFAEQVLVDV